MHDSILIRNGTLITMDRHDSVLNGDLSINKGHIAAIGQPVSVPHTLTLLDVLFFQALFRRTSIFVRHSSAARQTT